LSHQHVHTKAERRLLDAATHLPVVSELLAELDGEANLVVDLLVPVVVVRRREVRDLAVRESAERAFLELDQVELVGARADFRGDVEARRLRKPVPFRPQA
jgi:hypothetical protein